MFFCLAVDVWLIMYAEGDYWRPPACDCSEYPCIHRAPPIEEEPWFQGDPSWVKFPWNYDTL
jgi:hypothetical protein